MTVETQFNPKITASPDSIPDSVSVFNWRHCWYPIAFVHNLIINHPYSVSLYDEPLVLFKNQQGQLACLLDRCPHRAAKLSDGQIINNCLECPYHGWQFNTEGQCTHIPQLTAGNPIPRNASVRSYPVAERQGIVWIWAGEPEAANEKDIPTLGVLDQPGFVCSDLMLELPYDQTYLIENVIDPAHADISHNGTQGKRKHAQPLEMQILQRSIQGFQGRWRDTKKLNAAWHTVEFVAPNLVNYAFNLGKSNWLVGLAFYSLPLGKGRCRVLVRGYRNFFTWMWALKPRWLTHLKLNKVFEQDLLLIMGQQEQVARSGQNLRDLYLPLRSSDVFSIEYRKWLDQFGSTLQFYDGYSTNKPAEASISEVPTHSLLNRFSRHTRLCPSCSRTHRIATRLEQWLVIVAIAFAAWAIISDVSSAPTSSEQILFMVMASVSATLLAAVSHYFKQRFEHPILNSKLD